MLVTQAHFTDRGNEPETLLAKPDVRAESGPYGTVRTCTATGQLRAAGPPPSSAHSPGTRGLGSGVKQTQDQSRALPRLCNVVYSSTGSCLRSATDPQCGFRQVLNLSVPLGPPLLSEDEMVSTFMANVQVQESGARKTELPLAHCNPNTHLSLRSGTFMCTESFTPQTANSCSLLPPAPH